MGIAATSINNDLVKRSCEHMMHEKMPNVKKVTFVVMYNDIHLSAIMETKNSL